MMSSSYKDLLKKFSTNVYTEFFHKFNGLTLIFEDKVIPHSIIDNQFNFVSFNDIAVFPGLKGSEAWESILLDEKALSPYYMLFENQLNDQKIVTEQNVLAYVASLTKLQFFPDERRISEVYDQSASKAPWGSFKEDEISIPIPLTLFYEELLGVCRHQALFIAYLLGQYAKKNHLKDVSVYCISDVSGTDGHSVVIWKSKNKCYVIDSTLTNPVFDLAQYGNYQMLEKVHGEEMLHRIYIHMNLKPPMPPTSRRSFSRLGTSRPLPKIPVMMPPPLPLTPPPPLPQSLPPPLPITDITPPPLPKSLPPPLPKR